MKEKLKSLGINIKNEVLLETALTHSSYSNEKGGENYERLEFLGDAVLELISSEYLFLNTKDNEGNMSKIRASYVCEEALATYAEDIDLKKYILVGHGQEKDVNDTIVADVFESVLAVIYLEQGLEVAKNYTLNLIKPYIEKKFVLIMTINLCFKKWFKPIKKFRIPCNERRRSRSQPYLYNRSTN